MRRPERRPAAPRLRSRLTSRLQPQPESLQGQAREQEAMELGLELVRVLVPLTELVRGQGPVQVQERERHSSAVRGKQEMVRARGSIRLYRPPR